MDSGLTDLPALCLEKIAESLGKSDYHADALLRSDDVDAARDTLALWMTSRATRSELGARLAARIEPRVYVGCEIPWVRERPVGGLSFGQMSHMRMSLLCGGTSGVVATTALSQQALQQMGRDHDRKGESFLSTILVDLGPEVLDQVTARHYVPARRQLLALLGPDPAKRSKQLRDEHRSRCERRLAELDFTLERFGFARHTSRAAMTFASGHGMSDGLPVVASTDSTGRMTLSDALRETMTAWFEQQLHGATNAGRLTLAELTDRGADWRCMLCGRSEGATRSRRCGYLRRCEKCTNDKCFDAWRHRSDLLCTCRSAACLRNAAVGSCVAMACGCVALVEKVVEL